MKGLAWDDAPKDMESLQTELRSWGVDLVIEDKPNVFARRLLQESWDFVVTDLVDESTTSNDIRDAVGVKNAREAANRVPVVFIVTGHRQPVDLRPLDLPGNVILRSKDLPVAWLAGEICQMPKDREHIIDNNRVFLIYGHDRNAEGATGDVRNHLENQGLSVATGNTETLTATIPQDLLKLMRRCAAFVAICTPDDVGADNVRVPRANVLFEMGIAVGLSRELDRLIILQKWGPSKEEQALLPSDFGGNVPVRFTANLVNAIPILDQRLRNLGVGGTTT